MALTQATGASSTFDIDRARRDTPGVARVAHLNNACAALPPTQVTDAVIAHLRRESEMGGYEAADAVAEQVEHTYAAIARLIGARVDEIAVVENATRAWDMGFYGLALGPGDRILTARAEYASNVIAFLQVAKRTGALVEVIENDKTGELSVSDLRRRLGDDSGPVKLVAITHKRVTGLAKRLRERLTDVEGVRVHDQGQRRPPRPADAACGTWFARRSTTTTLTTNWASSPTSLPKAARTG